MDSSLKSAIALNWSNARPVLVVLLLGAFGLRVHGLVLQDIWWDEARNIDVALRPFLQVAVAPELDIHPPLYFWLLHVWGRISGTAMGMDPVQMAFVARFLSVLAGTIGVALVYVLALRYATLQAALLATAVGAGSPFWLAESQEARMYTVGFALLMAAAAVFRKELSSLARPVRSREEGRVPGTVTRTVTAYRHLALFVVLCALALITHYNAVFIVVAWYVAWGGWCLFQKEWWIRLKRALICGVAMTILVLPAAPIALRQIPEYANPNLTVPSPAEYLWQNWQAYIGGYAHAADSLSRFATAWLVGVLIVLVIGTALVLTAAVGRIRSEVPPRLSLYLYLLVWLIGGLILYYIAVVDRGAFNVRYSSFVTPALYAMLGTAMAGLGKLWKPLTAIAAVFVLAGFGPAIGADLYDPRFAREDMAGVTEWLRENAGPNDVVFVDQKYPFGFYYQRYGIAPQEPPPGGEVAEARYLFVDINTVEDRLSAWARTADRVFWVQWYESDTDPRRAVAFLLDKAGTRAGEEWFQGYSIDWWDLDPPNQFELAPNMVPSRHVFGRAVETVEVSLPGSEVVTDARLPVVIRWQRVPNGTVDLPLKARVGLYNGEGERVAQIDQRLLNDRHLLPAEWGFDDRPLNVYMLELPAAVEPGSYEIRLLVYDAETLQPLDVIDEAGNPMGIETSLGRVDVGPSHQ